MTGGDAVPCVASGRGHADPGAPGHHWARRGPDGARLLFDQSEYRRVQWGEVSLVDKVLRFKEERGQMVCDTGMIRAWLG
jgi:hypothetical protein